MSVPEISVDELAGQIANGAAVVDVREQFEWDEGYVGGCRRRRPRVACFRTHH